MPEVHPTSLIKGEVNLADDVEIGPGCVLDGTMGPITLGAGTVLSGNVYLTGPLTMGTGNMVYPFACLGFAPQHVKYDASNPGRGVFIGNDNTFREHATVHRAFTDDGPTRIGDRNYFMAGTHAGHDCTIGDDCTFVNGAMLAGHVEVGDKATLGGATAVHQFVRVGRGAMMGGGNVITQDLPPWFMLTGSDIAGSVNLIGMKRNGMPRGQIDAARWVHRTLYRNGLSLKAAVEQLHSRDDEPLVAEYIAFIESSKRGIVRGKGKAIRGTG